MKLIGLVIGGVAVLLAYLRLQRMQAAMREPVSSDRCAACESTQVRETGPECYQCLACGYEGGEGQANARALAFQDRVRTMTPQERFMTGVQTLETARACLVSADGTFAGALSDSRMDVMGSLNANEDKANTLSSALSEVMEAKAAIGQAAVLLDDVILAQLGLTELSVDFGSADFGLEHHYDLAFIDLRNHQKIKQAKREAATMLGAVERSLEKLRAAPAYRGTSG